MKTGCAFASMKGLLRLSQMFQPAVALPKGSRPKNEDVTSLSQKLLHDVGAVRQATPGAFHLLPLGMRAMEKLSKLVDLEMQSFGAQKISLATFTREDLWKRTGRIHSVGNELFTLKDRHDKTYILNPTYEESICDLIASMPSLSHRQLPLRLYQISEKYRDEIKPRFGLMRARQFLMKDLYTFDVDMESARHTYDVVCTSYKNIFDKLKIKHLKVRASAGIIGGSLSHEFHCPADVGEDRVMTCENCLYSGNVELTTDKKCPECRSDAHIVLKPAIEVGHTFLLGDRYSSPLKCTFVGTDGKPSVLQMGCYGLGLSRILAASIEVLSKDGEIRWPLVIAPYKLIIIPPKAGSKEECAATDQLLERLYHRLLSYGVLSEDTLIDDRSHMTIGKRIFEAKRTGYPFIIVAGSSTMNELPLYEIHDVAGDSCAYLSENDLWNYLMNKLVLN